MEPKVLVHNDVSPEAMDMFKELLATVAGQAALAIMPCQFHGQAATMLARMAPGFPGARPDQVGMVPLAVLINPELDAPYLAGPMGEVPMRGDGTHVAPKRQAHDGVPIRTGQYL